MLVFSSITETYLSLIAVTQYEWFSGADLLKLTNSIKYIKLFNPLSNISFCNSNDKWSIELDVGEFIIYWIFVVLFVVLFDFNLISLISSDSFFTWSSNEIVFSFLHYIIFIKL